MPTYEYKCKQCGHLYEVMQKITAEPLTKCPQCSQDTLVRKPGGGIGLSFKGPGFYVTDSSQQKGGGCCPCGKGNGCTT